MSTIIFVRSRDRLLAVIVTYSALNRPRPSRPIGTTARAPPGARSPRPIQSAVAHRLLAVQAIQRSASRRVFEQHAPAANGWCDALRDEPPHLCDRIRDDRLAE